MHKFVVLYPPQPDPEAFRKYYVATHIPLARKLPGLKALRYSFDVQGVGHPAPYSRIRSRVRRWRRAGRSQGIAARAGGRRRCAELCEGRSDAHSLLDEEQHVMDTRDRARRFTLALCFSAAACLAPAIAAASGKGKAPPPIMIEREGSFTAGGTVIGDSTKSLHCDHGFVDYQVPVHAERPRCSSGTAPASRCGSSAGMAARVISRYFSGADIPVYLWDGPRVGRGNMSCESYTYNPVVGQDQRNFVAWRFGPAAGQVVSRRAISERRCGSARSGDERALRRIRHREERAPRS